MGRASPATFSNKKPRGFLFVRGLAGGEKGVQPRPDPLPVEGGELVLRGGIGVSGARKEQPFGVVFERRGFQRPFDDPVFDEDEIGVFAHDLAHEGAFGAGEVARAEHPDFHDALEAVLGDGEDLPAEQVFAEEHAEIGGDGRRFFFLRERQTRALEAFVERRSLTVVFPVYIIKVTSSLSAWEMRLIFPPRRRESSSAAERRIWKASCGM